MLIPTDRRSVIAFNPSPRAGEWLRGGVPRGVGYHLIAYQVLDGQMVMAHRFVQSADDKTVTELTYEPVAILELKDKLAKILGS